MVEGDDDYGDEDEEEGIIAAKSAEAGAFAGRTVHVDCEKRSASAIVQW